MDDYEPSPYFVWSVHLDGDQQAHDHSVSQEGVYDKAVKAIKEAKRRGFRVNINCTLFNDADPARVAAFFDTLGPMGVDGITVSPGYAYERAPDQQHFLNRDKTKTLFREIFKRGNNGKNWSFSQSAMFLDFLAGNQTYQCTPWGNPARTVFGWQRPCYLLGEGYAKTFKELMETTEWEKYGTGNYEKCADCMVHSGFEATAVMDTVAHPLKALGVSLRGPRTEGAYAKDLPIDKQRPAEYVFSKHVEIKLEEIGRAKGNKGAKQAAACALSGAAAAGGGQVMSLIGAIHLPVCFGAFCRRTRAARVDDVRFAALRSTRGKSHGSIQHTDQSRQSRSRRLLAAREDPAQARLQRNPGGTGRRRFPAAAGELSVFERCGRHDGRQGQGAEVREERFGEGGGAGVGDLRGRRAFVTRWF